MITFFDNIKLLDQFTHDLDLHRDRVPCKHCKTGKYLRGHGFVYKRCFYSKSWASGKRIICSNRYNNQGCGRTRQLYVKKAIPQKHYHSRHLVLFILLLLHGRTVDQAYFNIRHPGETRNGYRWVQQLKTELTHWRTLIQSHELIEPRGHSSPTVRIFLSTLAPLVQQYSINFVSLLQTRLKRPFFAAHQG